MFFSNQKFIDKLILLLLTVYLFIQCDATTYLQEVDPNTRQSNYSCYDGSYAVKKPPFGLCAGFRLCEIGYYCLNNTKFACPAGKYGLTTGLKTNECSGICPAGFYCLEKSINQYSNNCGGSNFYCPESSGLPIEVPPGYYSVDITGLYSESSILNRVSIKICEKGFTCSGGVKTACPGGYYGDIEGLVIILLFVFVSLSNDTLLKYN